MVNLPPALDMARRGVPVVVSAPSGGGKTTLCHRVAKRLPGIEFSVSHTTRQPRPSEVAGVDYHFVDDTEFKRLVREGTFLEWAEVHGHLYGTSRHVATACLERGTDVFFDIDVQGGRQILERLPNAVLVFVVPPSIAVLQQRLQDRQSESAAEIARRLAAAAEEVRQATFYTHWIVNDWLDQAVEDLQAIIQAERLRRVDKQALMRQVLETR